MLESLKTYHVERGLPMQNSSLSAGCKNFRTHGLMLCLALLLIPRLSWCAEVSLEKVRLAYPSRSLSALYIRIAQEKGFYHRYGLQVEAIQVRPAVTVVALISGEVQYSSAVGRSEEHTSELQSQS